MEESIKTKILVTMGPSIWDPKIFRKVQEKVSGVRINSAHDNPEIHGKIIDMIRENSDLPIMIDLKGPEVRVCGNKNINEGDIVKIFGDPHESELYFSKNILEDLTPGALLLIEDGKLRMEIIEVKENYILAKALNTHKLEGRKNLAVRGVELKSLDEFTERDLEYIELAKEKDVEYIALSFARFGSTVVKAKKMVNKDTGVICKIEDVLGLKNYDEILQEADGIIVARGDLALNIGLEKVPMAQKEMIKKANEKGKLAIVATQVLDTMINKPYPTRAEISDIANAILDGADTIMLSGETSIGKYPLQAIDTIINVAKEVEKYVLPKEYKLESKISDAITHAVKNIALSFKNSKIITSTKTGYTARKISRFRLQAPIYALCNNKKIERKLKLFWGIYPKIEAIESEDTIYKAFETFKDKLEDEDILIFTAGVKTLKSKETNFIEVHKCKDLKKYFEVLK